jgi:hypothetical protein
VPRPLQKLLFINLNILERRRCQFRVHTAAANGNRRAKASEPAGRACFKNAFTVGAFNRRRTASIWRFARAISRISLLVTPFSIEETTPFSSVTQTRRNINNINKINNQPHQHHQTPNPHHLHPLQTPITSKCHSTPTHNTHTSSSSTVQINPT